VDVKITNKKSQINVVFICCTSRNMSENSRTHTHIAHVNCRHTHTSCHLLHHQMQMHTHTCQTQTFNTYTHMLLIMKLALQATCQNSQNTHTRDLHGNFPAVFPSLPAIILWLWEHSVQDTHRKGNIHCVPKKQNPQPLAVTLSNLI